MLKATNYFINRLLSYLKIITLIRITILKFKFNKFYSDKYLYNTLKEK